MTARSHWRSSLKDREVLENKGSIDVVDRDPASLACSKVL